MRTARTGVVEGRFVRWNVEQGRHRLTTVDGVAVLPCCTSQRLWSSYLLHVERSRGNANPAIAHGYQDNGYDPSSWQGPRPGIARSCIVHVVVPNDPTALTGLIRALPIGDFALFDA